MAAVSPARAQSSDSSFAGAADTFSHVASLSSTPPTTVADSASLASDSFKQDLIVASDLVDEPIRDSVEAQPPLESLEVVTVAGPTETTSETPRRELHDATLISKPAASTETPRAPVATTTTTPTDTPASGRSRRARANAPVYNLSKLSGTAIHGKRRANGDIVNERKRRTISGALPVSDPAGDADSSAGTPMGRGVEALDLDVKAQKPVASKPTTPKKRARSPEPEPEPRRISTRSSGVPAETAAEKLAAISKKGKKAAAQGLSKVSRELMKLQGTKEYLVGKEDPTPAIYTTWSKGKLVTHKNPEPAKKKPKVAKAPKEVAPPAPAPAEPFRRQKQPKKYLDRGLYSGQEPPADVFKCLTPSERKSLAEIPELAAPPKPNRTLPPPIFNGLRLLLQGRDFKLPFDVCNPLPPGQPKPEGWKTMSKNRFVGGAAAAWKKNPEFKDFMSKCVCTPEDGCGDSCQNKIMLYECDSNNCNAGAANCNNRSFAKLQERTKAGGKYRVGVEVVKTSDRGYGIRTNRQFNPGQIIMEYTGEIITLDECEDRMNEKYKDNQCYYLMSFDQNTIIDATTGSIARFVNHSCAPNCRMIKWIVSGQPRMALFAGDRPIMTGEELTYDYNFDPFSAKNVQKCLCGSDNCRGVLGPRPKELKPPKVPKTDLKKAVKAGAKAGKRKLKELLGDKEGDGPKAVKKRKVKAATGISAKASAKAVQRSIAAASLKVAKKAVAKKAVAKKAVAKNMVAKKTAAKVVKSVSTISVNSKAQASKKVTTVKRKSSVVKTYSKTKAVKKAAAAPKSTTPKKPTTPKKTTAASIPSKLVSRSSASTIVAAAGEKGSPPAAETADSPARNAALAKSNKTPTRAPGRPPKNGVASPSPRKAGDVRREANRIRLVQSPEERAAAA